MVNHRQLSIRLINHTGDKGPAFVVGSQDPHTSENSPQCLCTGHISVARKCQLNKGVYVLAGIGGF